MFDLPRRHAFLQSDDDLRVGIWATRRKARVRRRNASRRLPCAISGSGSRLLTSITSRYSRVKTGWSRSDETTVDFDTHAASAIVAVIIIRRQGAATVAG